MTNNQDSKSTATGQQGSPDKTLDMIPVIKLAGVGNKIAARLAVLGLESVQDLLFHLPLRYEDRTHVVAIGDLLNGQQAVVEAAVTDVQVVYAGRRILVCYVSDGSGSLALKFFNFNSRQQAALSPGLKLRCFGTAKIGKYGQEMVHPEYSRISTSSGLDETVSLTPVYPLTEGVHQLRMRKLVFQSLELAKSNPDKMQDYLSAKVFSALKLPGLLESLEHIHQPQADSSESAAESHPGRQYVQRLAFEELLAHRLSMRLLRRALRRSRAVSLPIKNQLPRRLLSQLPFQLTSAQRRVIDEIAADLQQDKPMMRLVHGDVGSGKTLVAAFAALQTIAAGYQVALMVPTEILAQQHSESFTHWFSPLGINVECITSQIKIARKRKILANIASGSAQLVVGTHALFQQHTEFSNLALIIIDEQHKFGVHQRLALKRKGEHAEVRPHQLVMTATPIPRTMAMISFADLDISVIDEMPAGRKKINTVVISDQRREEVIQRVHINCQQGRQAYWVCPLIDESDLIVCQAAAETAVQLREKLGDLNIGLAHGRLKTEEKQQVMAAFKNGDIDLLVATTVIEVGVDVANASLMIIENAERLGLAQLHQLRGRVGRGSIESACVLLYKAPLGKLAKQRLQVMRESLDGFFIAQKDLEIRGPGEVFGSRQTGELKFRIADPLRDAHLLASIQTTAEEILINEQHIVKPLIRRWLGASIQLGSV